MLMGLFVAACSGAISVGCSCVDYGLSGLVVGRMFGMCLVT